MQMKKKIIVMAVGAALGIGAQSSFAAITVSGAATSQNVFAIELANDESVITNAGGKLAASAPVTSYGPSTAQPLYITVSLDQGAKFVSNPQIVCSARELGAVTGQVSASWQLGGAGASTASYIIVPATVTAQLNTSGAVGPSVLGACIVSGTNFTNVTGNVAPITMTVGYAYGSLSTSTQTGTLISFAKTVSAALTPASNIAEVASGFLAFTNAASAATTAHLGTINWNSVYGGGTGYLADGATVATPANIIGSASITLTGAGLALAAAATTGGVYLVSAGTSCVAGAKLYSATAGATVTFTAVTAVDAASGFEVCMSVNGTSAIPVDTITASITATGKAGTVALLREPDVSLASSTLSTITRNGTTLVAPLVQIPAGWLSRMVLSNAGTTAAAYAVTALSETGNAITLTGAAASGSIPAGGVAIVDLPTLMTSAGAAIRGGLSVVVAGTNANISGVYQIVNPTGNLSNYTMILK